MASNRSPSTIIEFPDGTRFRRTGECHGCEGTGQCCTYIQLPLARALSGDEIRWVELHPGLTVRGQDIRIEIACSALVEGKCTLYGTPDRPHICDLYPESPDLDEGCGYKLEKLKGSGG